MKPRLTPAQRREASRQGLLRYKQDLEHELLRVKASLDEGTAEDFKAKHIPWPALWPRKPVADHFVQRKPGAKFEKDTKGSPEEGAKDITATSKVRLRPLALLESEIQKKKPAPKK
jgi:hypothetical protein